MAEIPRCHRPSLHDFREKYALPGLPVILTGLTDHWKARQWTPESIAARYPDASVDITPQGSTVEGTRSVSLTDYVASIHDGEDKGDYLTSWCFRTDCPELLDDFEVPEYFKEDWLEELPELNDMLWLFLGAKGSGMGLHQDLGHTAAWNTQVTGRKKWALISPEYDEYVYEGKVDAFKPNRVRYAKFRRAEVLVGEVSAGEVLFIPGAWWHQTLNLETGFAITSNFVDVTNFQKVLECLKNSEEESLYSMLTEIAKRKVKMWT